MKNFKIQLIDTLMRFLIIHNIAALAMAMFGEFGYYKLAAVLLAAAVIFLVARNKIKNGIVFMLLHLGVLSAVFLLSDGIFRLAAVAAVAADMINSMIVRFYNKEVKRYSGLISLVFAVSFAVGAYFSKTEFMMCSIIEAVSFVGLKFILDGLQNTEEFIAINEKIADMPVSLIRKRIAVFLIIFVAFAALAMCIGMNSGLSEAIEGIGKYIAAAFAGIFRKRKPIESQQVDFSVFSDTQLPDTSGLNLKTGKAMPPIVQALGRIMVYAALTVFAVFIVKYIIIKAKSFIADLYDTRNNGDVSEFIAPEEKSAATFFRSKPNFSRFSDSLPNDAKIRKMYKKYIMKEKKKDISKSLTPQEISVLLKLKDDERIRQLYEKAKYAKSECTREEIREMKELLRNNS